MKAIFLISCAFFLLLACNRADDYTSKAKPHGESFVTEPFAHPDWSVNATIYQANIRQHTPEGTINAFRKDLKRLSEMGIEILWLTPIHPIGNINRQGLYGDPYAVNDHRKVNPDLGTLNDFKTLVLEAHDLGMKVIIDWVAYQTALDHPWTYDYPDWYNRDSLANTIPAESDSLDYATLNLERPLLQIELINCMKFWLMETDIDGFHCSEAMKVPIQFWENTRLSLDSIKPVFMLAEAEDPSLHKTAFDMTYASEFLRLMNQIAVSQSNLKTVDNYLLRQDSIFPPDAYRMNFTALERVNIETGTEIERFANAHQVYATLGFTFGGMPLLHAGQESGFPNAIPLHEKDTIEWNNYPFQDFYTRLLKLHQNNPALWNGASGGSFKRIEVDSPYVLAYTRKKDEHEIIVMLNFSEVKQQVRLRAAVEGELKSIFNEQIFSIYSAGDISLEPFGFQVFAK